MKVCPDHAVADPGQAEYGRAWKLTSTIQILLIPSYGMAIKDGLRCKEGGIVFHVDGRINGSSDVKINTIHVASQPATDLGSRINVYGPFDIPS